MLCLGEQGWRSGESTGLPGSIPGFYAICGLSLLVLYSAPRGFSPGTPVFPSPQNPTFAGVNGLVNWLVRSFRSKGFPVRSSVTSTSVSTFL